MGCLIVVGPNVLNVFIINNPFIPIEIKDQRAGVAKCGLSTNVSATRLFILHPFTISINHNHRFWDFFEGISGFCLRKPKVQDMETNTHISKEQMQLGKSPFTEGNERIRRTQVLPSLHFANKSVCLRNIVSRNYMKNSIELLHSDWLWVERCFDPDLNIIEYTAFWG